MSRMAGELDRRQRDLVLAGEVRDRFHVQVVRHQNEGHRLHGDERTHFLWRAGRLVPNGRKRRSAGPDEIGLAGKQRVKFCRWTDTLRPRRLDVTTPRRLGILLDQLLRFDDDHRQIG
jgi:hypothetical protein